MPVGLVPTLLIEPFVDLGDLLKPLLVLAQLADPLPEVVDIPLVEVGVEVQRTVGL